MPTFFSTIKQRAIAHRTQLTIGAIGIAIVGITLLGGHQNISKLQGNMLNGGSEIEQCVAQGNPFEHCCAKLPDQPECTSKDDKQSEEPSIIQQCVAQGNPFEHCCAKLPDQPECTSKDDRRK